MLSAFHFQGFIYIVFLIHSISKINFFNSSPTSFYKQYWGSWNLKKTKTTPGKTISSEASLSITNSQSLLKLMPVESVMPSSHLILCLPLLLLPPIPPSIGVFSSMSTLRMRWPKFWSFSFSISTSNEHPGLTSFRMDWLDLLAVQGTLKRLLQHHSSKAPVPRRSAFFMVHLSAWH